jgi:hypothetical protein
MLKRRIGILRGDCINDHIVPVALQKAYRLINHGPTVLVSARHDGVANVMVGMDLDRSTFLY